MSDAKKPEPKPYVEVEHENSIFIRLRKGGTRYSIQPEPKYPVFIEYDDEGNPVGVMIMKPFGEWYSE